MIFSIQLYKSKNIIIEGQIKKEIVKQLLFEINSNNKKYKIEYFCNKTFMLKTQKQAIPKLSITLYLRKAKSKIKIPKNYISNTEIFKNCFYFYQFRNIIFILQLL